MKRSGKIKLFSFIVILLVVLYGTGCDNNFDPLEESDDHNFTMYGALDLHADTQWVRVMPIGKALIPKNPEPSDVTVILVREKSGETSTLKDSLFTIGNNALVWNYWTTMSLHPNENYTLRANGPEGTSSTYFNPFAMENFECGWSCNKSIIRRPDPTTLRNGVRESSVNGLLLLQPLARHGRLDLRKKLISEHLC